MSRWTAVNIRFFQLACFSTPISNLGTGPAHILIRGSLATVPSQVTHSACRDKDGGGLHEPPHLTKDIAPWSSVNYLLASEMRQRIRYNWNESEVAKKRKEKEKSTVQVSDKLFIAQTFLNTSIFIQLEKN